jgi:hypothetical protein
MLSLAKIKLADNNSIGCPHNQVSQGFPLHFDIRIGNLVFSGDSLTLFAASIGDSAS